MRIWKKQWLRDMVGSHILSDEGARIQIVSIPDIEVDFWEIPKGQLLIIGLKGAFSIEQREKTEKLGEGDEVYLFENEVFRLKRSDPSIEVIVQLLWLPGVSENFISE